MTARFVFLLTFAFAAPAFADFEGFSCIDDATLHIRPYLTRFDLLPNGDGTFRATYLPKESNDGIPVLLTSEIEIRRTSEQEPFVVYGDNISVSPDGPRHWVHVRRHIVIDPISAPTETLEIIVGHHSFDGSPVRPNETIEFRLSDCRLL